MGHSNAISLKFLASYASIGIAFFLVLLKLYGFFITGSMSVLTSLLDSSVDVLSSLFTLWGLKHAARPADRTHRFGHGKAEPLTALAQAGFVIGSCVLLFYTALGKVWNPDSIEQHMVGVWIMGITIFLTLGLLAFQKFVIQKTNSVAIKADHLHYQGDLWINISVLISLGLSSYTGWAFIDPIFALCIGIFWSISAVQIAKSALHILMDHELSKEIRQAIKNSVMMHPDAKGLHDLRTREGGNCQFIEFHLELEETLTLAQAHEITDQIEDRLKDQFPTAEILIHQEPAGLEDDRLDHRLQKS